MNQVKCKPVFSAANQECVCPIKATTTPRLELSATLLLVRLVSKVISIIQVPINHIYMWTDSTIVLAWIKTPHEKLKTYVSNRVKTINTLCPNYDWRHVNSADNPADLISRGTSATNLVNNTLWFHGPTFIKSDISLPVETIDLENNEFLNEVKTSCESVLICNYSNDSISDILNLSNSFWKLCRIFAKNNVTPNDMVVLKDSGLPPYKWRLGRIQEIIKGSDGYVTVVRVKVSNGVETLEDQGYSPGGTARHLWVLYRYSYEVVFYVRSCACL
ncbi:hypothetical protein AVEN_141840-1 [Araneus ventricosus]|uniref:DUF5641 domain-containing protein n=1 Tax=Araneus ventricosus TaxID=182803 RepID=A0A4Y2IIT2_ARAVE|nr:hypothetical protein AVEN_141840-1 [Araneus ventricosus]